MERQQSIINRLQLVGAEDQYFLTAYAEIINDKSNRNTSKGNDLNDTYNYLTVRTKMEFFPG